MIVGKRALAVIDQVAVVVPRIGDPVDIDQTMCGVIGKSFGTELGLLRDAIPVFDIWINPIGQRLKCRSVGRTFSKNRT